jgi:hypothetical protein
MKMIIADLDGTLVHKKEMSDKTKQTIQRLQNEGYLFTLATGRHKDAVRTMSQALNITLPIICTNGAMIYDFQQEKTLHQDLIDPQVANQVLSLLDENQTNYLLYTTQSIVSTRSAKTLLESRIGTFDSVVVESNQIQSYVSLGLLKILIIEPNDIHFNDLRLKLSKIDSVYVLSSQASFLDIGNKVANKGRALKILCDQLGLPLTAVLSIGDQENDLTMIQLAGIGVAMGDGDAILKEQAKYVTKSFKEDGFTHAINTLIFKD